MTKLYKFHLTLIQLLKKNFFFKSPLDWDETWKIPTQSTISFPTMKLWANENKVWWEHFTTSTIGRVTASIIPVDETSGKRPVAEIQSVTLFCWRFHPWRFSFPVTKFSQEGHSCFLETCEVLASLALFTMETCTWIELQCMTWYKHRRMFDACCFLFVLIWKF